MYNPNSRFGLLTTFKLEYYTKNIYEVAAIWDLPFFVKGTLEMTLNSLRSPLPTSSPVFASDSTTEPSIQKKLLQSYLEIANYF